MAILDKKFFTKFKYSKMSNFKFFLSYLYLLSIVPLNKRLLTKGNALSKISTFIREFQLNFANRLHIVDFPYRNERGEYFTGAR